MTARYHIDLFWWPEDETRVANVPDLPGCSAHGDTPEEAIREIGVAMELWLETARDAGDPIPQSTYRSEVSTLAKAA